MKLLAPFFKPVFFSLLIVFGLRRIFWPERVWKAKMAEAAKKKKSSAGTDALPTKSDPESIARSARSVRTVGFAWVIFGCAGFWFNPVHLGLSPLPTASALGNGEFSTVEARAREFIEKHSLVNLSVAVVSGGKEAIFGFGPESLFGRGKVDGETLFEIGSITKTFTGILFSKMVLEGSVSLDQPLKTLLPAEIQLPEEWRDKITLRHLTTHSSGLPHMPPNFPGLSGAVRFLAGLDPHPAYTQKKFIEGIAKSKLVFTPGDKSDYSNFGVSLLGYALAEKLGGTYEEVILREVCQPLGMSSTTISLNPQQRPRIAQGYDRTWKIGPLLVARAAPHWTLPNSFAGAGALRSTAKDMVLYLKANMGLIDSPLSKALAQAHQPLMKESDKMSVGMNWLRLHEKDGKPDIVWHNGGTGGFRSFIGFTDDGRHGVVLLSGTTRGLDSLGLEILKELQEKASTAAAIASAAH